MKIEHFNPKTFIAFNAYTILSGNALYIHVVHCQCNLVIHYTIYCLLSVDKPRLYLRRNVFLTIEKEKDIVSNKISSNIIDFLYQEVSTSITR